MSQKNRDKEYWLIPKRANLHQSVVLLKGILELNYNGKSWNGSKQDRLGSYLGKNGATNSGKNITPQSLRTLLSSIPQYFGLVFINTNTTPNTLHLTESGLQIVKELESFLDSYDYPNLKEAEKNRDTINFSDIYLKQFLKLQITNPIILKDCEGLLVFPLIFTLQILKKTRYLTYEEISIFVFRSKSQSEVEFVALEIENFRNLDYHNQLNMVNAFKKTHLGNISLVQAPSSSYFQKLCSYTSFIRKSFIELSCDYEKRKVNTIEIIPESEIYVDSFLKKYNLKPYDFKDNLNLWIQYIGNPEIFYAPKDIKVINKTNNEQLVVVSQNNSIITGDLIKPDDFITFPSLEKYIYKIYIYNQTNGEILKSINYEFSSVDTVELKNIKSNSLNKIMISQIRDEIINHINSRDFSENYLNYISIISNILGKNLQKSKNLRGSRLEHLFYTFFCEWENDNIVDEVIWNGKIGQYGIPTPSPGGPTGTPDIIIFIDDIIVVIELTTIKSKSQQWSAEGASVPDHIRLISEKYPNKNIYGLYMAPIIHHERVTKGMLSRLKNYDTKLKCVEISKFINYSKNIKNKYDFIKFLNSRV